VSELIFYSLRILGAGYSIPRDAVFSCGVNLTRLLIWTEISIKYLGLRVIVVRMHVSQ
jgi:hypothetical protein